MQRTVVLLVVLPTSVTLVRSDSTLYATGSLSDLNSCKTDYLGLYFCRASRFAFLPITSNACEVALTETNASRALRVCPYRHVVPSPLFHKTFSGFHYFFFPSPQYVSVVCPNGTFATEVTGHFAVRLACHLHSSDLTTFPERLHHGFDSTNIPPLFPIESLQNLNFSTIKFVTNTLSSFHFSNQSALESAIHQSMPFYLTPPVHVSSLMVPVLIFLIVLIPVCCMVRKALMLYNLLHRNVQNPPSEATP